VSGVRWLLATAAVVAAGIGASPAQAADGWFTVPVSTANDGSASESAAGFLGASADGSVVYFVTSDPVLPDEDTDSQVDIYARRGASLELASGAAPGAPDGGAGSLTARRSSADGSTVVFQTADALAPEDTDDGEIDLYEHSGGATRLVSVPDPSLTPGFDFPFFSPVLDMSPDGRLIAFSTTSKLSPSDNDSSSDVYVYDRSTGATKFASPGLSGSVTVLRMGGGRVFMQAGDIYSFDTASSTVTLQTPGTNETLNFSGISADGSHMWFETKEKLAAADNDGGERDVYQFAAGQTTLISTAAGFANGIDASGFQRGSADGSIVYFTTPDQLSSDDMDGGTDDIYKRFANGTVELVSQGPDETLTFYNAVFSTITPDGRHAFFYTAQDLADGDDDGGFTDAYERADGVTKRISVGEPADQANYDASFAGTSDDASRVFFQTQAKFTSADTDGFEDLYSRHAGNNALVTPGGACTLLPSSRCVPEWHGNSSSGDRIWFLSDEALTPGDDDPSATDVWESRLALPGAVSDSLVVHDPYDDLFAARVHVSGFSEGDSLTYEGAIPGTLSGDTLTLNGRATDADYQAALRSVVFSPGSSPGTRTLAYSVDNGSGLGPPGVRTVVVPSPPSPAPEPTPDPGPPIRFPGPPGPPLLKITDTGDWVAHLRPKRVFRVPGLTFYCPGRAASACTATVAVAGAGAHGTLKVAPGETRGIRLTASRAAARRLARHGRLQLRATAAYTLPGSDATSAVKRFRLLGHRRHRRR
jgi:hypothetical protein